MQSAVKVFLVGLVVAGCASSPQSGGPDVTVHLAQMNMPRDIFYFAGPINIQYQLTITNPTDEPLTLQRLDLETIGPGAYSLRTSGTPMNLKVPPKSTTTFTISVWGRSHGGYMAATEPVTIRGTAYFRSEISKRAFLRIFTENIFPS